MLELGIIYNLNDRVRVQLNEVGVALIEKYREDLRRKAPRVAPSLDWSGLYRLDADNWLEIQLWDLMRLFGPAVNLESKPPFQRCEVTIRVTGGR